MTVLFPLVGSEKESQVAQGHVETAEKEATERMAARARALEEQAQVAAAKSARAAKHAAKHAKKSIHIVDGVNIGDVSTDSDLSDVSSEDSSDDKGLQDASSASYSLNRDEQGALSGQAEGVVTPGVAAKTKYKGADAAKEVAAEVEVQTAEEVWLAADVKVAEEARLAAEAKAAEEAQLAAEAKAAEKARLAAEAQAAEEARLAAEAEAVEEARLAAQAQAAEEARLAAEANAVEEARLAAEAAEAKAKAAEDARLAEDQAAEKAKSAVEAIATEEAQLASETDFREKNDATQSAEDNASSEETAISIVAKIDDRTTEEITAAAKAVKKIRKKLLGLSAVQREGVASEIFDAVVDRDRSDGSWCDCTAPVYFCLDISLSWIIIPSHTPFLVIAVLWAVIQLITMTSWTW